MKLEEGTEQKLRNTMQALLGSSFTQVTRIYVKQFSVQLEEAIVTKQHFRRNELL